MRVSDIDLFAGPGTHGEPISLTFGRIGHGHDLAFTPSANQTRPGDIVAAIRIIAFDFRHFILLPYIKIVVQIGFR